MVEINFVEIEKKWQEAWEKEKIFEVKEDSKKKKCYVLEMFPYPSGAGLHMGHALNYTIGDIQARFKRMNNFNVLYPMGYDAFGLPAENAAIKVGEHPGKYTENSMNNFVMQQKSLGLSYDWSKKLATCDPEYYKWNQYLFLKFFEAGLVYRKKSAVNWCPKCATVLANEQVHNGKCWRHSDTDVETKQLEQWFIKITKYVEELLNEIPKLDWPNRIKVLQENWIGKSFGTEVIFKINNDDWKVFTTRPDTLYGVTFLVISAQHSKLFDLVTKEEKPKVEAFLKKLKSVSEKELEDMEKEGIFTGSYAINPLTKEKVPIYAGNFVVADYASGMVMAVPAHDQRDFEFAKKYSIPIKLVIQNKENNLKLNEMQRAYTDNGLLVNSDKFNGLHNREAIDKITEYLQSINLGSKTVLYKLRDWLISRQRYWGTPIPMIYCDKCGIVPVNEKDLPILLPEKVKFGEGNPLATNSEFINVKCPKCNGSAKRETDTMDTFFDSSWYFLRYPDSKNAKVPFDNAKVKYWMPVDHYIGGAEHACMHLIYARFFTKVLRDLKYIEFGEPFNKLFNQGMLYGEDGNKMSKSLGNVVNPIDIINKYSADSLRFNLMSLASPDKDSVWSNNGMESANKFVNKFVDFYTNIKIGKTNVKIEHLVNKTIKEYTEDIANYKYNVGIIKLRTLLDVVSQEKELAKQDLESILKLMHPLCPHITEELWHKLGNKDFISLSNWPVADEKKINDKFDKEDKALNNLAEDLNNILKIIQDKKTKAFVYVIPNELEFLKDLSSVEKKTGLEIKVFAVNDKAKYDPENKSGKAKLNKPAIHLE